MGITVYSCGCAISISMFGEHEVIAVNYCLEHAMKSKVLRLAADEIIKMQNEDNKEKK